VYIIDTGVRLSHHEFANRVSCGFSAYYDNCEDQYGHGTHVAGIIGGTISGVAKNASLVAVKVLGDDGSGTWADVLAGIEYVINEKKKCPQAPMVINMSLGDSFDTLANAGVAKAIDTGIVVVVAAGNDRSDACLVSPASTKKAITVAAISQANLISYFSNVGRCVDIFAPGEKILSTSPYDDSSYIMLDGTSVASPFVAGVAALHMDKTPTLTPNQVWKAIRMDAHLYRIRRFWNALGAPNLLVNSKSLYK
jgi:serine protease